MFTTPDFSAPLSVSVYVEAAPADGAVKGMYFKSLVESAPSVAATRSRYVGFREYPLTEYIQLCADAAIARHPRLPRREGLRRIGQEAYRVFASSMIGKVTVGLFGDDLDRILGVTAAGYKHSIKPARVRSEKHGDRHHRVHFEDIYNFLDSYQVGVFEGAIALHGFAPDVKVELDSPFSGRLDVRWR